MGNEKVTTECVENVLGRLAVKGSIERSGLWWGLWIKRGPFKDGKD